MKKLILIVLSLSFYFATFAQERKVFEVESFNAIEVHQSFKVYLSQGENYSVSVIAKDELTDIIDVKTEGQKLVIDAKSKSVTKKGYWSWRKNNVTVYNKNKECKETANIDVFITFPTIAYLEITGAVQVIGETPLEFSKFKLDMRGASEVNLDLKTETLLIDQSGISKVQLTLNTTKIYSDLSGSSQINLELQQPISNLFTNLSGSSHMKVKGDCTSVKAKCSGASSIDGEVLNVESADLDCSGASSIIFGTLQSLIVNASGASNIKYKSSLIPTDVNIQKSGGASVYAY